MNMPEDVHFNKYIQMINPVIIKAVSDIDFLLDIPFRNSKDSQCLGYAALSKLAGVRVEIIKVLDNQGRFQEIYDQFSKLGISRPNIGGLTCNLLRKTERAKRYINAHREVLSQIPIVNGRISVTAFIRLPFVKKLEIAGMYHLISKNDKIPELNDIYEGFLNWIFEQVVLDGNFDKDSFVSYRDKEKQRKKNVEGASAWAIFKAARGYEGYTDSIASLGNVENFNALMVLFALSSKRVSANSSIENYLSAFMAVKKFLAVNNIAHSSPLELYINEYTALRFRTYIEDVMLGKNLSPMQASNYVSCLNLTLERLSKFKEFEHKSFIYAPGFDAGSASQKGIAYTPYTQEERNLIQIKLDSKINGLKDSWLSTYVKSEHDYNFFKDKENKKIINSNAVTLERLKSWFDNQCNSIPFYFYECKKADNEDPRTTFKRALVFLKNRQEFDGTMIDLWDLWKVPNRILTARDLIPFYLKLIQVTGMNPSSILDLEIDDFVVSHDATNRPCLRYWKARSTGEKEYHLDIFKCDITWLSLGQAKVVKDIFDTLLSITKHVRKNASDDINKKLFIFNNTCRQKVGKFKWHEPMSLALKQVNIYLKEFSQDLKNENGDNIEVIATRFRSSFISELVNNGVPIREIQMIMGHASILVTLSYLDRMDFNKQARKKIFTALTQIYTNSYDIKTKSENYDVNLNNLQDVMYKTPLGGCKNIFSPPDFIQTMRGYKKGSACSNFNKCLSCNNVIISRAHLPDLFALYRDYTQVARNTGLMGTPHGNVIQDNIDILESILGENSEFSATELEIAKRLSLNIESTILIDGVSL